MLKTSINVSVNERYLEYLSSHSLFRVVSNTENFLLLCSGFSHIGLPHCYFTKTCKIVSKLGNNQKEK